LLFGDLWLLRISSIFLVLVSKFPNLSFVNISSFLVRSNYAFNFS
jgi:hypothetical protein